MFTARHKLSPISGEQALTLKGAVTPQCRPYYNTYISQNMTVRYSNNHEAKPPSPRVTLLSTAAIKSGQQPRTASSVSKPLDTKRQLAPTIIPRPHAPHPLESHPFHSRRLSDAVPVVPLIESANACPALELPVTFLSAAALATAAAAAGSVTAMGPDEDQVATAR